MLNERESFGEWRGRGDDGSGGGGEQSPKKKLIGAKTGA